MFQYPIQNGYRMGKRDSQCAGLCPQTFSILYSNGKYVEGKGGRVCRRIEL